MTRIRTAFCWASLAVAFLVLSACSMFTDYTKTMRPVTAAVQAGNPDAALKRFPEKGLQSTNDKVCYMLEKGSLQHIGGKFEESNRTFGHLSEMFVDNDMRAKIAVGKILEGGGSLLLNDKTMAYEGEPYQRVFMHTLEATNYLSLNDREKARVMIKQGYEESKALADVREAEIENSHARYKSQGLSNGVSEDNLLTSAFGKVFSDAHLNDLKNHTVDPYQNAFTEYLSSVVYEMEGGYNNAYIACASAHKIAPQAKVASRELARLAAKSGMGDRKKEWEKEFGPVHDPSEDSGAVVVLFQCGMAAHKEPIQFSMPVPVLDSNSGNYSVVAVNVSFPRYVTTPSRAAGLDVAQKDQVLGSTEVLTDLDAIALQSFYDRLPALLIRLAIRASIKATLENTARGRIGSVGNVGIPNLMPPSILAFTEQADVRSWLLAPANLQAVRLALPEGEQTLELSLKDANGNEIATRKVPVQVTRGKFTIVNLRAVDDFVGDVLVTKPM